MSKLRSGPATVFCSQQSAGLPHPGAQTCGAPGFGNGRKSGVAVGIGLTLLGFVLVVNPVNPFSSPVTGCPPLLTEPFGSESGPNVLGCPVFGSMPKSYELSAARV